MHFETLAIQSTLAHDQNAAAVVPPMVLSTTFERAADGSHPQGYVYSRAENPNRQQLEQSLAALESGAAALSFSSGMAAIAAVFQSLGTGQHIILPVDAYYSSILLADEVYQSWGLSYTCVDMSSAENVRLALQLNTSLIWIESPSNPQLGIAPIAQIAALGRQIGALVVVDNTYATSVWQQPLSLGAHISMHSSSKYLGGHSDVLGGALIFQEKNEYYQKIKNIQKLGGAVPSPFDCWLLLRGIKTLSVRVKAQTESAQKIAAFLQKHPNVEKVYYPGLESHKNHNFAAEQMSGYGAMLSFNLKGTEAHALAFTGKVQLFTAATSLGGVESLIEHRRSVEGAKSISPPNLLRLSIGLEHADDLIHDLDQGLKNF